MTTLNTSYAPIPERKSSRWPPSPGVYVNVEFKVPMSENDKGHGASLRYTSKNMRERERARKNVQLGNSSIPAILTPGRPQPSQQPHYQQRPQQQQQRTRGLVIRTETAERGRSAPPIMNDRSDPVSPVSPMSSFGSPIQQRVVTFPRQNLADRFDRPLPPTPGKFRLGEDGLPWSTTPSYWNAKPDTSESVDSTPRSIESLQSPSSARRNEDPKRVRELSELQQAMMTVDSMSSDVWDPWMWDSVGDLPRGPRSIGWAVSSNDASNSPKAPPPPPYVVSQWEESYNKRMAAGRPKSTG